MSNISDLVERLIAHGVSVGEASEIIALAVAAGAATYPHRAKPKQQTLFTDGVNEDRAFRGKKPLKPIPDEFHLNGVLRDFATKNGFPKQDFMFEQFKAHHRAKGSKFVDWEAAWRTWVLNQRKFNGDAPQQPRPPVTNDGRI